MNKSNSEPALSEMDLLFEAIGKDNQSILNECVSRPKFYITVRSFEILDDHTVYIVEKGVYDETNRNVHITFHRLRYSEILSIYNAVKMQCLKNFSWYVFPPKKW